MDWKRDSSQNGRAERLHRPALPPWFEVPGYRSIMKRHGRPARLKAERPLRTVSSPEETISFTLLSRHQTLYVERESIDPSGSRRIVAAAFRQPDDFVRWCEADQARFASPLIYSRARKAGLDILSRIPAPTRPG